MTECQCNHMHWGLSSSYDKVPVWSCTLGTEDGTDGVANVKKGLIQSGNKFDNKKDKEILVMGERKRKIYKREGLSTQNMSVEVIKAGAARENHLKHYNLIRIFWNKQFRKKLVIN